MTKIRNLDADILRLAVPALGALMAEPLFLLVDSAMIGHLGVVPLAGLGLAGAILQTIVGLMVFLAYATTPAVARRWGAGDIRGAVQIGIDGLWLALGLGVVLAAVGVGVAPALVDLFGSGPDVAQAATSYLTISMLGLPAMLVIFAATGLLRGLQDTRTPLWVAGIGFGANIALNAVFIYGAGLGLAGSAIGTVLAQWAMVLAYLLVVGRHARRVGASARPHRASVGFFAQSGGWLLIRTISLRAAMLAAVFVATSFGPAELAAYQVAMTVFSAVAFALDALAIAAQALIGHRLGGGDLVAVRQVLTRCVQWGVGSGVILGAVVVSTAWVLPAAFTSSPEVLGLLPLALVLVGVSAPLGGLVFVLDGVLIGAGDARYLAYSGLVNLACFLPLAAAVLFWAPSGDAGLIWLTASFTLGFLAFRALTLGLRARTTAWMA